MKAKDNLQKYADEVRKKYEQELLRMRKDCEEYLYETSHELCAPLREIDLYASFLDEDCGELLNEESKEDLAAIRKTAQQSIEMIHQFMEYTRSGAENLDRSIVNVRSVIKECYKDLHAESFNRDIKVELGEIPSIIADEVLVSRMIRNILSNSIKFTQNVEHAKISVYSYRESEQTSICFQDNGIGFDMHYAAKIFDVFERLQTGNTFQGYGIGLATVKKIAEKLGGEVDVFAQMNKGCTITVRIPNQFVVMPEINQKKNRVKIGVLYTSSGEYASIAQNRKAAYELAASEINNSGGILGNKVTLILKDFNSNVDKAQKLAWQLTEIEHVDVLMGGFLSSAREAIRSVVDKTKTLYFYNALYEGGVADHYTFCTSVVPEQNLYPLLDYLFKRFGSRVYIISTDYNYGFLSTECAKDYIEKKHGTVISVDYALSSKDNFKLVIENINATNPDIILSFLVGDNQNIFYKQWHSYGNKEIPIISNAAIYLSGLHKIFECPIMYNLYFMASYNEITEKEGSSFAEKIRAWQKSKGTAYVEGDAEAAYTALFLYKEAVEAANSFNTEAVIKALESGNIHYDGPAGLVSVNPADHHVIRDVAIFRVDENHEVKVIQKIPQAKSDYIENILYDETGVRGGLMKLGINAPNIQYNALYRKSYR